MRITKTKIDFHLALQKLVGTKNLLMRLKLKFQVKNFHKNIENYVVTEFVNNNRDYNAQISILQTCKRKRIYGLDEEQISTEVMRKIVIETSVSSQRIFLKVARRI